MRHIFMLKIFRASITRVFPSCLGLALVAACFALPLGIFESDTGVGPGRFPGRSEFNGSTGEYTVKGAGGQIGGKTDSFQYVWTQMTGDVTVNADAHFMGIGATDRTQATLMIRQSLDPDAPYVAAVLCGAGKTMAQYRVDKGASSRNADLPEFTNMWGIVHLSIRRRGNSFSIAVGKMGKRGGPIPVSAPVMVTMNGPVYVGLAVGSPDDAQPVSAVFSSVSLQGATEK